MINYISDIPTIANTATPSFEVRTPTSTLSSTSTPKAAQSQEDSVELSSAAQQYLTAYQAYSNPGQELVAQIVRAAASGDSGALSLLTVI